MPAAAFVSALRAEYVEGTDGAVGEYFDKYGENPQFDALEDRVRNAKNKAATVAEIESEICGPLPGQPQEGAGANPSAFVAALQAEYVQGRGGAVGEYFDKYGESPEYDALEGRVRNAGNKAAAVAEVRREICGPTNPPPQANTQQGPARAWSPPPQPGNDLEAGDAEEEGKPEPGDVIVFKDWCKKNGCMSRMVLEAASKQVEQDMADNGENPEIDAEYMRYQYSLCCGKRESSRPKVEIEDTKTQKARDAGIARLKAFLKPILILGWSFQVLLVVAMVGSLASVDCKGGTTTNQLLIATLVAVVCWWVVMTCTIEYLLRLQSNTMLEGVPLVRFMAYKTGLWRRPQVLLLFLLSTIHTKIAGAAFIGKVIRCSTEGDDSLQGRTLNSLFDDWATDSSSAGGAGLTVVASIFFILPLIIQTLRACRSWRSIKERLACMDDKQDAEGADAHLEVSECIDDFSSVAGWALLTPVSAVFDKAALPLKLEDKNDARRVWDLYKTRALASAADLCPDAIVKLWLVCINFALVANSQGFVEMLQLALLVLSSAGSALYAAYGILKRGFALTTLIGTAMVIFVILPLVYPIATLACGEDRFVTVAFGCLPIALP